MNSLQSLLLVLAVIYTTGISTGVTSSIDNTAIVNLTTAINQLLTQSTGKCPLTISRDILFDIRVTLNNFMQLMFAEQILAKDSLSSTHDELKKSIAEINGKIDLLNETVHYLSCKLPQRSCEDILTKWPSSSSGYYPIADVNGHVRQVYCHMESLCGKGGGWTRVAHLNMTDSNETCPEQFRLYSKNGVRACGRPVSSGGSCTGIKFSLDHFEYSEVCGKVIGYQVGAPDGFATGTSSIDTYYVDGISLTHGSNPRKHIWTFVAGQRDRHIWNRCPCGSSPTTPPSFVGTNYYCESGNHDSYYIEKNFYTTDRIWDGKECGSHETTCCQRSLIPWFYRSLGNSTTDYIEMRNCFNEGTNEDCPLEEYEIYVR